MTHKRQLVSRVIVSLTFIIISILTLKYKKTTPYFYVALEFFVMSIFMILITKEKTNRFLTPRFMLFNIAVIILFLGFIELYLSGSFIIKPSNLITETHSSGYCLPDEIRGYAAKRDTAAKSKKMHGNNVAFNTTYTTNQYGLRVTPHDLRLSEHGQIDNYQSVVFFGCSFVFGEGVNDNETLPYLFEEKSHGKYMAYNFGFSGYGPHQMLRILESDLLDPIINHGRQPIAIYLALFSHIDRASGNYPYITWDDSGPFYKINSQGTLEYSGKLKDKFKKSILLNNGPISRILKKSFIFKKVYYRWIYAWRRSQDDIELFIQIIKKSQEIFNKKYKGHLYVILWADNADKDYYKIVSSINKSGLNVVTTDAIFTGYSTLPENYKIKYDGHPNRLAYDKLADYILEYLQNLK